MKTFASFEELKGYLSGQPLEFFTEAVTLSLRRVHLLAIATGDFNPHYCHPDFANEHSFFGGPVSHGIGTVARAEAEFVPLLQQYFTFPIETIALGYGNISYRAPLKIGDRYRYHYKVESEKLRKTRYDFKCTMTCEVLSGDGWRVIMDAVWRPSIIAQPATEEVWKYLSPKSYRRNLYEVFLQPLVKPFERPIRFAATAMASALLLSGPVMLVLSILGKHYVPGMDLTMLQAPPL